MLYEVITRQGRTFNMIIDGTYIKSSRYFKPVKSMRMPGIICVDARPVNVFTFLIVKYGNPDRTKWFPIALRIR